MSAFVRETTIKTGANDVIQSEESCRCFSLAEIQSATNNFDESLVVGIGGFGKVYKGLIDGGALTVAVKRLNVASKQGAHEFWTEFKMLSKLRHAHLVALIGYCSDCSEMILVYEYVARGALVDHLYKKHRKDCTPDISHLSWEQRLNICIGAARGLDYLHTGTNQCFIHRDVKSTNILLDEKWLAKISDFGLSKIIASHSITHVTTDLKGTPGYFDPHYIHTRRLTKKSDVYSYGVVLLEVLCGRPLVDESLEEQQISLVLWARHCIKKGKFDQIIDPSLGGQISTPSLKSFKKITTNCLHNDPKKRPSMAVVLEDLERALASQQMMGIKREGLMNKVLKGITLVPRVFNLWTSDRAGKEACEAREAREAAWAMEQRTLHGLHFATRDTTRHTFLDISTMAEEARRRAEIARLRELHVLKGRVESFAKLNGLDII